jgi:uncharacterized membrane protein
MHELRWPVRTGLAGLALLLLVRTEAQAAMTATVCNQSTTSMWVGFGYYVDDAVKWATTGWWWADPNECTESVRLNADVREVYVYANTLDDDVEWQGTKSLCVSMDGAFEYDDAENRACAVKRLFKKYGPDASGSVTATLRDEEAARVAYNLTLCNKTDDYVSIALGNAPETHQGISADGWFGVESGQCQTYVRRGKSDYAYFYAQAPGRRLVWYGNIALCTRYHGRFAFESADSNACQDGDSERLPFVKVPLAKGAGSYDLTAEGAHVFKSGLNVCNGYSEDIYPAIAHLDGIWMNGILARGFWRLHPGECKLIDSVATGSIYLYAETADLGKVWAGKDLSGCVRNEGFTFPGVEHLACDGKGERRAGFFAWNVSEGANVYKFE